MSLLKIPVTLLVAHGLLNTLIPPQPAPRKEELMSTTKDESTTLFRLIYVFPVLQAAISFAEAAVILGHAFPSYQLSQHALRLFLTSNEQAAQLRLNTVNVIGACLVTTGSMLRSRAYKELGRFFRFQASIQEDHKLITTGLYSYVRHPSYTGAWMVFLGWAFWSCAEGSWFRESAVLETSWGRVVFASMCLIVATAWRMSIDRMKNEDKGLKAAFGKEWDEWREKVPYSLIPGVF